MFKVCSFCAFYDEIFVEIDRIFLPLYAEENKRRNKRDL